MENINDISALSTGPMRRTCAIPREPRWTPFHAGVPVVLPATELAAPVTLQLSVFNPESGLTSEAIPLEVVALEE